MLEAEALFSKRICFDSSTLEIFSHGESTARIAVHDIKEIKRTEEGGGLVFFLTYGTGWVTFGFNAVQRTQGENLIHELETTRSTSPDVS